MKTIKNIITLMLFFAAFFIIYFGLYLFKVADNNIYQNISINIIKELMDHYFFAIIIVSSASSIIFIGALNKFSGHFSIIITIIILGIMLTLYPAYTVVFNKNIDYLRNELNNKSSLFISENGKYLTRIDNYLIKVGYKLLDNTYKNVILIDPLITKKLYIGDYLYFTDKEISMHQVTEIYGTERKSKSSVIFERDSFENYISSFAADIIFGFESFPIIAALLKIVTLSNIPNYAIILLFINLSFIFLSLYLLGLSLNSKQYIYHNIMNAIVLYGIIKIIIAVFIKNYNLLELIVRNLNYWTMNIYLFIIAVIITITSLILKKLLNSDKKIIE